MGGGARRGGGGRGGGGGGGRGGERGGALCQRSKESGNSTEIAATDSGEAKEGARYAVR